MRTALRWRDILAGFGFQVEISEGYDGKPADLLVALHAVRNRSAALRFRATYPELPLIVALTGTDLYVDLRHDPTRREALAAATRLIVLQAKALEELKPEERAKAAVIYQSAPPPSGLEPAPTRPQPGNRALETPYAGEDGAGEGTQEDARKLVRAEPGSFLVAVAAHLRAVKDPLRAAYAVRSLPQRSRIRVVHAGRALESEYEEAARDEARANTRYTWCGELPYLETRRLIAQADLVAITSFAEGSSNVLSEALASGTPVVSSRIPGIAGTLGDDYPGYFTPGDTDGLRALLQRAEEDPDFLGALRRSCERARELVRPERERASWRALLEELGFRLPAAP